MKNFKILLIALFVFITVFFALNFCLAQPASAASQTWADRTGNLTETAGKTGVSTTVSIPKVVAAIIQTVLGLVSVVFFILFIWAGVRWMTAAGNDEKIAKAKKIIINSVIGLALVVTAYTTTYFIASSLENPAGPATQPSGSPGAGVPCPDTSLCKASCGAGESQITGTCSSGVCCIRDCAQSCGGLGCESTECPDPPCNWKEVSLGRNTCTCPMANIGKTCR